MTARDAGQKKREANRDAPPESALPPMSVRAGPPSEQPERGVDIGAVMRVEEESRARIFFQVLIGLAVMVSCFLPFLPGANWLRGAVGALLAISVFLAVLALFALRRRLYTPGFVTAVGVVCAVLGVGVMIYIGLFSAGVMVLDLGIFFFGMSHSRAAARVTFIAITVLYGVAAVPSSPPSSCRT